MEFPLKVLILGANGQIAQVARELFLQRSDAQLTLYLRRAKRLSVHDPEREQVVEGDVLDLKTLESVVAGQDVVYANLSGQMKQQAQNIVKAMHGCGVKRLIFISSMGIYGEIPGERYQSILDPYRDSASVIEASDLDYTIIRPAWLNDREEIAYGTTRKGEPFENASDVVSRKSIADLVVKLATTPTLHVRQSLGVHRRS
jgi:uncharacterized protein YbjT (DUF2867 family)